MNKEAFSLGDVASGIGTVAKAAPSILYDILVRPPVNAVKDTGRAIQLADAGDLSGAGWKGLSALGNTALTAMNFVPFVGWAGRGLAAGAMWGSAALRGAEAVNAASKLERAGSLAGSVMNAPNEFVKGVKGLNIISGHKKILPNPVTGSNAFVRGAKGFGRGLVNATPALGAYGTVGAAGLGFEGTRSGKMDAMLDSDLLQKYIGNKLPQEIGNLSQRDKLTVFEKLEQMGLPKKILGDWAQPSA